MNILFIWPYQTFGWGDEEPQGRLLAAALSSHPLKAECPLGSIRFEPRGWGWRPGGNITYSSSCKLKATWHLATCRRSEHLTTHWRLLCYWKLNLYLHKLKVKGSLETFIKRQIKKNMSWLVHAFLPSRLRNTTNTFPQRGQDIVWNIWLPEPIRYYSGTFLIFYFEDYKLILTHFLK